MCGIAGIINFRNGAIDPALIRRMTASMAHRGPDAECHFEEEGVAFGHRRLSIIDLSTSSNQPFIDHSGRYVMVFNGEIYNYAEVKALIRDYPFVTNGDTEVLLAAYIQWGAACLDQLRGFFSAMIWDREKKEAFLVRDPFGVKPLYYFMDDQRLIFASEVRAILASGLVRRKISLPGVLEYLSYQSVSSPYSIVEDIRQLDAASWMTVRGGRVEQQRYWEVTRAHAGFDFSDTDSVRRKVRELLLQSVRRRLVSDVPVGAFLSGGIDSSAVVGLMAEAGGVAPNTFNICFEEKEYDESRYAEIVAKKFNAHHTRILLRPTIFLDELVNALGAMDIPSGDGINTYIVSKAIRQQRMTVALSGIGGDELFAGYPFFGHYLDLRRRDWLWKLPSPVRRGIAAAFGGGGKRDKLRQLLREDSSFIDSSYPIFRQIISPASVKELTTLIPDGSWRTVVGEQLAARRGGLERLPSLSQVSAAEYLGYTQHTLLKDTDQMSMAVSLEVREPFFDLDLVEFVLAVPDRLKKNDTPGNGTRKNGTPKSLLVESLYPMLPDKIVYRKKQGFLLPWELWLRKDLRDFCARRLNNMAQREFVHGAELMDRWRRFLREDADVRWAEIWLFVVLDFWLDHNDVT